MECVLDGTGLVERDGHGVLSNAELTATLVEGSTHSTVWGFKSLMGELSGAVTESAAEATLGESKARMGDDVGELVELATKQRRARQTLA